MDALVRESNKVITSWPKHKMKPLIRNDYMQAEITIFTSLCQDREPIMEGFAVVYELRISVSIHAKKPRG